MPESTSSSLDGIAPPVREPNDRGCPGEYHSAFCECLASRAANRLLLAAKELLQAIDREPIRKAALACEAPLYERAAALIDAISQAEARS